MLWNAIILALYHAQGDSMIQSLIRNGEQIMQGSLNNDQMKKLQDVLKHTFYGIEVVSIDQRGADNGKSSMELLDLFIAAKQVEGCSEKTLKYYKPTIKKMIEGVDKSVNQIETDDIRKYLTNFHRDNVSKVTIDNIRRILSSFFAWLEEENYILKSPVRRIHKVRIAKTIKETYSDEAVETLRDNCSHIRDLAIVDLLASTGIRVGELVKLDISDIDFDNRECIVLGKGDKERIVYFDARTKLHLQKYIAQRTDQNEALFVSLLKPHKRLEISGVEIRLRKLGLKLNMPKVHPHKFRRTLATKAIDKGMPIEQVQQLLGHAKIDTTMEYAMVNQNNVKISHRKFIS